MKFLKNIEICTLGVITALGLCSCASTSTSQPAVNYAAGLAKYSATPRNLALDIRVDNQAVATVKRDLKLDIEYPDLSCQQSIETALVESNRFNVIAKYLSSEGKSKMKAMADVGEIELKNKKTKQPDSFMNIAVKLTSQVKRVGYFHETRFRAELHYQLLDQNKKVILSGVKRGGVRVRTKFGARHSVVSGVDVKKSGDSQIQKALVFATNKMLKDIAVQIPLFAPVTSIRGKQGNIAQGTTRGWQENMIVDLIRRNANGSYQKLASGVMGKPMNSEASFRIQEFADGIDDKMVKKMAKNPEKLKQLFIYSEGKQIKK